MGMNGWFMVFNATFNNISYVVAISFIGGGNRRTGEQSLTNFYHIILFCPSGIQTGMNGGIIENC